jgi:hypothetical protein
MKGDAKIAEIAKSAKSESQNQQGKVRRENSLMRYGAIKSVGMLRLALVRTSRTRATLSMTGSRGLDKEGVTVKQPETKGG